MHTFISEQKPRFVKAIEYLQGELVGIRTGRANPALVEDVMVSAYGTETPVKGLGTINVPDSKTLTIEPWDKGLLKDIEAGIQKADIGINPTVDGEIIRLTMPEMTEENRKDMVKRMKEKLEEARVKVRAVREDVRDQVGKMEKAKDISEDEKYNMLEDLDKMTKEFTEEVDSIGKQKEDEIMTV